MPQAAGAVDDGLNLSQFYYWIHHMFNDFEQEDYDDCMSELMNYATEMRLAELASRGQANSRPDKISYCDANTGQNITTTDFVSITELVCRESASFSTGAIILTPSDAVGVDLKFEVDPRFDMILSQSCLICCCALQTALGIKPWSDWHNLWQSRTRDVRQTNLYNNCTKQTGFSNM